MRRGFTLIEVLLVTAVFASVSLAVFTCLSNGLRLWGRSQQAVREQDALIFMDRLSSDIQNSFPHSEILFSGGRSEFAFPSIVLTPADSAGAQAEEVYVEQIGRVRYSFDSGRGRVLREQANYSEALRGVYGAPQTMVSGAAGFSFGYFYGGSREALSEPRSGDVVPSGIGVELRFIGEGPDKVIRRYFSIPAGV